MRLTSKYINFLMEKNNYFAEDSLALKTSNVIKQLTNYDSNKQAIPSFVLEGPIGSDTSFYTEIYKKILQDVLDKEIYLVKYQGGSNDVSGLEENTIISEKLTEAISQANQGKQVLLLIDKCEYLDKKFDTFIHDFEKTGKVMFPKKGKLEVKPNCRENLQIILCVDDINSLAEPLIKRNAKIKLELMTPENLGKMIKMNLPNSNENIQSILMILYKKLYENKDNFAMFPSFSDTMQAIQDASDLLEKKSISRYCFCKYSI